MISGSEGGVVMLMAVVVTVNVNVVVVVVLKFYICKSKCSIRKDKFGMA